METRSGVPRKDEHQLAEAQNLAARGWAYLKENLDLFAPDDPFDSQDLQRLCELALLFSYSVSWSGGQVKDSLKPIEGFLLKFLSDPEIAQYGRKRLALYNPYFVPYLALRMLGYRLNAYEEGLTAARRAGYPDALELTPYRELEIQHLTWKAGLRPQRPSCNIAYAGTVLARCGNPVHLNKPAVYSVTHTLFYLNDYAGPPLVLASSEKRRAAEIVEGLLIHYWRKKDWDIVGELALNLVSLDRWDSTVFHRGVQALFRTWTNQRDGALPGPGYQAGQDESGRDYRFTHCYHTTLVGILLCEAYCYRAKMG